MVMRHRLLAKEGLKGRKKPLGREGEMPSSVNDDYSSAGTSCLLEVGRRKQRGVQYVANLGIGFMCKMRLSRLALAKSSESISTQIKSIDQIQRQC